MKGLTLNALDIICEQDNNHSAQHNRQPSGSRSAEQKH